MDSELGLLEKLLDEGRAFTWETFWYPHDGYPGEFAGPDQPTWAVWKTRTLNTIKHMMAESSPALKLAIVGTRIETHGNGPDKFGRARATCLKAIELAIAALQEDAYGELRTAESTNASPALSNRVFVVHGHDSGLKTDLERFLREIRLEPVVLHRQPDEGGTIIEKFEKHSDVGFAFILLTSDEFAYTSDQEALEDVKRTKEIRARPNVIFEFGYFVARLGGNRVCALVKGDVSVPSDLSGLIYKRVEDSVDPQAYSIIRELRAAGYEIVV
jgi:predicted nucleotide-binding protein